ncbi:MAG: hypothetical protein M1339_01910 [Bacteroidetes bacterium]|nr:hypothetical protein [Bacteroidota bacterium]
MRHIDEHTLELLALGDKKIRKSERQIKKHLAECSGCKALFSEITRFYEDVLEEHESEVPALSSLTKRALVRKRNDLEPYFAKPDLDVVSYEEVKVPSVWKRMSRIGREHPVRAALAMFAFIATLSLGAGFMSKIIVPIPNPAYVHLNIERGMMDVFSRNNRLLWSLPGSNLNSIEYNIANFGSSYWQIADLNSDGQNEVVTVIPGLGASTTDSPVLQIFGQKGRLLRETAMDPGTISYVEASYPQHFLPMNLIVMNSDKGQSKELFVGITDGHSPYCVVKLDAQGHVLGEYWHFGNLVGMSPVTLAGGKTYLALLGENDVDDRTTGSFPVIVILNPDEIIGRTESTVTPGFGFQLSRAEVYYVKLPNCDMNYALKAYMSVQDLTGETRNMLAFSLRSAQSSVGSTDGLPTFDVAFSKGMRVLSYSASNASITLHAAMEKQGMVKGELDQAYLDRLKNGVRYWNGNEWVKTPTPIIHRAIGQQSVSIGKHK